MQPFSTSLAILALTFSASAIAQDTRTVTEPVIPPFCTKLEAHLTSVNDGTYSTLAAADESKHLRFCDSRKDSVTSVMPATP